MTMTTHATPQDLFERMTQGFLGHADDLTEDIWAADLVVETPFAAPGRPRRIEGREAFFAVARAGRAALPVRFEECREIVVHQTADPEVIVVEYELVGVHTRTGRRAAASFVGVLRARDGRVAHWREYQDTVAIARELGQLPALLASAAAPVEAG
jgi:uncharacterized protein